MISKNTIIKTLSILGNIFIATPILFMIGTSLYALIIKQVFLCDYLIPGELFPIVFIGSIMISIISWYINYHRKLFSTNILGVFIFFALLIIIPQLTGLASGEAAPTGFLGIIIYTIIAIYDLLVFSEVILGCFLIKEIFKNKNVRI